MKCNRSQFNTIFHPTQHMELQYERIIFGKYNTFTEIYLMMILWFVQNFRSITL